MRITLDALELMNRQQLFDVMCAGLLKQNARSTAFDGLRCQYRGDRGTKCAIGMLIPDAIYDRNLEFMGVKDLCERIGRTPEGARAANVLRAHLPLLMRMQDIHDSALPCDWRSAMREAAAAFNLRFTEDDTPDDSMRVRAMTERSA
jgi:hypothetical protein